ncbi:hypothetical protein MTO96_000077 [Rhipicephalus appendiculatus]
MAFRFPSMMSQSSMADTDDDSSDVAPPPPPKPTIDTKLIVIVVVVTVVVSFLVSLIVGLILGAIEGGGSEANNTNMAGKAPGPVAQVCPALPVCPGTATPCTAAMPCPPIPRRLAAVFRTGDDPPLDNVPGAHRQSPGTGRRHLRRQSPGTHRRQASRVHPVRSLAYVQASTCHAMRESCEPKQRKLRHQKRLRNQQHAKRPAKKPPSEDDSQTSGEMASEEASQRSAQPVVAGRRCHEGDQCDDGRSCPSRGRCTGDGRECEADHPCSDDEGGECERRCPAKGPKEGRRKHRVHPAATTSSGLREVSYEDTSKQPTTENGETRHEAGKTTPTAEASTQQETSETSKSS